MAGLTYESGLPGPWERDLTHMPHPVTPMFEALMPDSFAAGFVESFAAYGFPLHGIAMQVVNSYVYMQIVPLAAAHGEEELGAVLSTRAAAAERAFAERLWRAQLAEWQQRIKPGALAAHAALAQVDLPSLSGDALALHLDACMEHHRAMVRQHHRHNGAAMLPVGDFAAHVMEWTGRSAAEIVTVFEAYSPMSGVWSEEIAAAATAAADDEARALLQSTADPAKQLFELRMRSSAIDSYVRVVSHRVVDGFDITAPTIGELPALVLGKLRAAVEMGGPPSRDTADERAARLRDDVPAAHRQTFDDLLAEARLLYGLRDDRGVCSDMSSAGLLRLALLELGRRMEASGHAGVADHALLLAPDEAVPAATGYGGVSAVELEERAALLAALAHEDPPMRIGDPHAPPPAGELPPALARVIAAFGSLSGPRQQAPSDERAAAPGVLRGTCGHPGRYEGTARVISRAIDLLDVEPGDVIVASTTSEAFNAAIHLAGAIVTDHGGLTSHAAIVAREVGIPAVVGTGTATTRIADGALVIVDATEGTVTVAR